MFSYSLGGASDWGLELCTVQRKCHPPSRQKAPPVDAQVLTKRPCFPSLRVETKLQTLEAQFTDLDSSLQKLAQKFEVQAEMLEKETSPDTPWRWVPEER